MRSLSGPLWGRACVGGDLLLDKRVIVEIKSTERPSLVHQRQLLTYLRLSGLQVGLLINFGLDQLRHGITRVVNHYREDFSPSALSASPSGSA